MGDVNRAIEDYDKAIELNPNIALAYRHRALAKSAKGDVAGAQADMMMARKLDPRL
jgi:tetratricopeptide (TPR) repeat protein